MRNYVLYEDGGKVVQSGSARAEDLSAQCPAHLSLLELDVLLLPSDLRKHRVEGGCLIKLEEIEENSQSDYSIKRRMDYPAIEEFADAFYWQSKGDDKKMAAYLARCQAVKEAIPKI